MTKVISNLAKGHFLPKIKIKGGLYRLFNYSGWESSIYRYNWYLQQDDDWVGMDGIPRWVWLVWMFWSPKLRSTRWYYGVGRLDTSSQGVFLQPEEHWNRLETTVREIERPVGPPEWHPGHTRYRLTSWNGRFHISSIVLFLGVPEIAQICEKWLYSMQRDPTGPSRALLRTPRGLRMERGSQNLFS